MKEIFFDKTINAVNDESIFSSELTPSNSSQRNTRQRIDELLEEQYLRKLLDGEPEGWFNDWKDADDEIE